MTKAQIQSEILKVLDSIPENVLYNVLDFLKGLSDHPVEKIKLANHLHQILMEDNELLEKLSK